MEALHQPGDIIDQRYRILNTLGKGGIGTTYAAENLQTGERVALKVVSLRGTNDPKVLDLFGREARILSQLDHPGIPRYLDYFQVNKRRNSYFYLAQQLVEGQSLFELVDNGWQPQEVEIWHIANQILDILVYLQQFTPPVIHRDIKPHNIIRRSDGKVFLVDFGAVQDVYHGTLTGGSTVAGTYGYMAPEQFRGKTVLATDLYGLGATLIFLLTQKDPADLPKRKLKIDFRPHIQVTKRFADWLERMIEPVAEERFRSAGEALMVWQGKKELSSSATSEKLPSDKAQSDFKNNSSLPPGYILRRANSQDRSNLCKLFFSDPNFYFYPNFSTSLFVKFLIRIKTWKNLLLLICLKVLLVSSALLLGVIIDFSSKLIGESQLLWLILILLTLGSPCVVIASLISSTFYSIIAKNISISNCWVIEYNKIIVAFGAFHNLDGDLYINQLFVEQNRRGIGLGSALIKHLIQEIPKPIYVYSPLDLVEFYTHLDFVPSSLKGINVQGSRINITLVYKNTFSSASEKADRPNILKSEESLVVLAKQGNAKAITTLLYQHLQVKETNIKTRINNNYLLVLLESDKNLNKQRISALICEKIVDFGIENINLVKVYGRRKGEEHPAWKSEIEIVASAQASFSPDWTIRKATSRDRLKIIQLLLHQDIFNFPLKKDYFYTSWYSIFFMLVFSFVVTGISIVLFLLDSSSYDAPSSYLAPLFLFIGLLPSILLMGIIILLICVFIGYWLYLFVIKGLLNLVKMFLLNKDDLSNYRVIDRNGKIVAILPYQLCEHSLQKFCKYYWVRLIA